MPSSDKKNEVHVDYRHLFDGLHIATAVHRGDECPTCNNGTTKNRGHHGSTKTFRNGYDAIDWSKVRSNAMSN